MANGRTVQDVIRRARATVRAASAENVEERSDSILVALLTQPAPAGLPLSEKRGRATMRRCRRSVYLVEVHHEGRALGLHHVRAESSQKAAAYVLNQQDSTARITSGAEARDVSFKDTWHARGSHVHYTIYVSALIVEDA